MEEYSYVCSLKGYGFWRVLVWKGYRFWLIWSEIGYIFRSGLALGVSFTKNYFFQINIPKFVGLLQYWGSWKPILVGCGHILQLCTIFWGLKWVFNFPLKSEKGYLKHRFWSEVGFRGSDHSPNQKLWRVPPPPRPLWLSAIRRKLSTATVS